MKQAAKESLEAGPAPGQRAMLVRLAMLLVFASSTSLAWWSVNHRLLPVLLEGQRKASAVSALSDEVQLKVLITWSDIASVTHAVTVYENIFNWQ